MNPFSGAATAFAEAVLPEGTPVVTAPVVAGSQVRFNEPGTAFVASATAAAGVVDGPVEERPEDATISGTPEPQVVPIRVASGEVISSDQLVAVLLDSGLGIIPPHVSDSSRLTVHVGRDAVIRERSEAASPGADDKDHAGSRDNDDGETTIAVNNGAVVASVLTDLPYSDLRVGNSEGVKASSRTHIEILVDGQKQGEVATFSQVNPKQFEGKPLQIWTLNEQGQYRRKGEFHGEVVDATLQVRFDKPVYRLGDQGVLLIWNQEAFRRAQEKYRVGGKTNPADWMLKIDASASAAGIPKQAPFSTHRLPFTVVTKGALSATVQAEQQF